MELRRVVGMLWRRAWLILLASILAAVPSYLYIRSLPPSYEATATLVVSFGSDPQGGLPGSQSGQTDGMAKTFTEQLNSLVLARDIVSALGVNLAPESLPRLIQIQSVSGTQLLRINAVTGSPELAAALANKTAEILVAQVADNQQSRFQSVIKDLQNQVADLESQIAKTQKTLTSLSNPLDPTNINASPAARAQIAQLQSQLSSYEAQHTLQIQSLENSRLNAARYSDSVRIYAPATTPRQPLPQPVAQRVLIGLTAGLALGVSAAFLLEYLDDTLKEPEQLEAALGLSSLGSVGRIRRRDDSGEGVLARGNGSSPPVPDGQNHRARRRPNAVARAWRGVAGRVRASVTPDSRDADDRLRHLHRPGADLVTVADPQSPAAEDYRVIRTNFQFTALAKGCRSVVITSAVAGEGKSTTLVNLGIALAQAGKRTILVDTDLRRPVVDKLFGVPREPGLTGLLLNPEVGLEHALLSTSVPLLQVLPSGPLPPNPADILGSATMSDLIKALEGMADFVLYDSPPILAVADATALAAVLGNVVLVTASGQARSAAIVRAVKILERVNARILGVVLNKVSQRGDPYSYYRYYPAEPDSNGVATREPHPAERRGAPP